MSRVMQILLVACLAVVAVLGQEHSSETVLRDHKKASDFELIEEEAQTEAPAVKPKDVLSNIYTLLVQQLHNKHLQWVNGLVAFVVGVVMLINGEFSWRKLVIGSIAVFMYLLTTSSMKAHYAENFPNLVCNLVAVEVAACISWVAFRGFEGVNLLIGMMVGALSYYYLHAYFSTHAFADSWPFFLICGNICVMAGVCFFFGKTHRLAMALISSVAGGCLVVSSIAYFVMFFAVMGGPIDGLKIPSEAPPWVQFAQLLVEAGSKPVGLFAGSSYNLEDGKISMDQLLGRIFWVIISILGLTMQIRKEKKQKKQVEKVPVKAKGDIEKPLLRP